MDQTVSVVIPTRNRASYVVEAVRSALAQSHLPLEVIVVDDASTDTTPSVLGRLSESEGIRVVRHFQPRGACVARNRGAREARGDYLAFLDDDCVYRSYAIGRMLRSIVSDNASFAYCKLLVTEIDGRSVVEGEPGAARSGTRGLLTRNYVSATGILVRRDIFEEIGGFDEALPRLQDWDLALRLLRRGRAVFVNEILVSGRMIRGGISDDSDALKVAAHLMLERAEAVYGLSRADRSRFGLGLTKYLLAAGQQNEAWRVAWKVVRHNPVSVAAWASVLTGLLGPKGARFVRGVRQRMQLRSSTA